MAALSLTSTNNSEELEFYILAIARQFCLPISIFEHPRLEEAINRGLPAGCSPADLRPAFDRLLTRGEVELLALDRPCCGLTAAGGARWESLCDYDWESHTNCDEGASAGAMEASLAWFGRQLPSSIRYETVSPWDATYWKTLPSGVRALYEEPAEEAYVFRLNPLWAKEWNHLARGEFRARRTVYPPRPAQWWQWTLSELLHGVANVPVADPGAELRRVLTGSDPGRRLAAVTLAFEMKLLDEVPLPEEDPDPQVRANVVWALGRPRMEDESPLVRFCSRMWVRRRSLAVPSETFSA